MRVDRRQAGAVYVEFLITVIPLLMLMMAIVQLGLWDVTRLMVTMAAQKTVRAAVVILPDDHEKADYDGVAINTVGDGSGGIDSYRAASSGGRYHTIRKAARMVLAPLSPKLEELVNAPTVERAVSPGGVVDLAAGLGLWTDYAVGLGFVNDQGEYVDSFSATGMVHVRVAYLFKCTVPMVSSLMCKAYDDLPQEGRSLLEVNGQVLSLARFIPSWRFLVVWGEATLPNQGRR